MRRTIALGALTCVSLACQPPGEHPATEIGETGLLPRGIYLPVPYEHAQASGAVDSLVGRRASSPLFVGPGDPPLPIYLNRYGGTYSPGPDDSRNNTSIIPNSTSNVSGYSGSEADWQQVVVCLEDMFSRFNAVIVETEPGSGAYIEAVIGGTPGQVGLPNGVGGVAPIDNFNCGVIQNAIVFAFSDNFGSAPQTTCEVAAQEIAHAISLDHEFHCPDPMTYLNGCGQKEFRDYDAQCGEYSPRSCNCGRARQNSVQVLTEKLGANTGQPPPPPPPADPVPPLIGITSPADGDVLQENSTITVTATASDDVQLAATELFWAFSNNTFPCPYSGGGGAVTCTRNGLTSTWNIRVGQGTRTFYATARDAAGNVTQTPPRTIQLGTAQPPPDDTVPPVVSVVRPNDGEELAANSTIQVEATASDDTGLAGVELVWTFAQDSFPCPFQGQGILCEQQGDTYTWSLSVGVGTRRFSVRATDLAGNVTETTERTITLTSDMPPDPAVDTVGEDNDKAADAFPSRCGSAIDLVVSSMDEDWFSYEVPADAEVEIGVSATPGTVIGVELYDLSASQLLGESADVLADGGAVRVVSPGPGILARITTPGDAVPYRLSAVCGAPDPDPDPDPEPDPADDAYEDNDDPASAARVACGDAKKDLTAADPDFFILEVGEGDSLHVSLNGAGSQVTVLDASGAPMVPAAGSEVMVEDLPEGDVLVRIDPDGDPVGYDVSFECTPVDGNVPEEGLRRVSTVGGGCGCDATAGGPDGALFPFFLVGLLWALRRR